MAEQGHHVPSVGRAMDLLQAVAAAPDGLAAGALEDEVGGSRSGLFALLTTLKARGWLVQDATGAYRIGPGLRRLVPVVDHDDRGLRRALADATDIREPDEAIALVRPDGPDRIVIATHDGRHHVRCVHRVGQVRSASTADAVVLDPDVVGPDGADNDVHWPRPGVARIDQDEAVGLAAPVCRDGRIPVAAVMAEIPRQRADPDHLADIAALVATLARDVSVSLGAPGWQPWGRIASEPIGPPRELDDDEVAELLRGRHAAQLACMRNDGTPHVVPLWFDWDGDAFWLTASPGSAWATYVGAGCQVSLTVEEPRPDLRRVFVTGWARRVDDDEVATHVPGGVAGLRRRLLERSMGRDGAADDDADQTGWTAVRVVPDRIHGRAGLGQVAA